MIDSLADLLDLQHVDTALDRLLDERSSLPALAKYRASHEALGAAERRVEELSDRAEQLRLSLDKAEGELKLLEHKIDSETKRLYGGSIGAKEAVNYQREIESLDQRRGDKETEVLELMDAREQAETNLQSSVVEVEQLTRRKGELEAEVTDLWKEIDAHIGRKEARKAEIVPMIDPDVLEVYDEIRSSHDGVGVGRLDHGVCSACHLALSPAEQAEVAKEELPRCIHCGRILVL